MFGWFKKNNKVVSEPQGDGTPGLHEPGPAPAAQPPADPAVEPAPALPAASTSVPVEAPPAIAPRAQGLVTRLFGGLGKSSAKLGAAIGAVFTRRKLDAETLAEFEDTLIASDLGPAAASRIIAQIRQQRFEKEASESELKGYLADEIAAILRPREAPLDLSVSSPCVVLVVGVNGSGKTTTIGKIGWHLARLGQKVVLAAGDTFRAAAIDQLRVWAQRAQAIFVARAPGSDAAGLAYEAVETAKREGADVVLIDTAGRLQNKAELMAELAKIVRAIRKVDASAPHHVLLVLDATVGRNALSQTDAFRSVAGVTGLVMTKLDGTAKGGVLVALAQAHALPIHYIGVGEGTDDLQPFSADAFARALVGLET